MVDVFALAPLAVGLLLWFCFPPRRGLTAQELPRRSAGKPARDDREK